MDQHGIADALSRALGIPVHYEPIEIAEFIGRIDEQRDSPHTWSSTCPQSSRTISDGIFAGTNDYVQTIGGKTPMTVEEYAQAHREAFSHDGPYSIPAPANAS